MNSHNVDSKTRDEPTFIEGDDERVRQLKVELAAESELKIDDDFDLGGDPYNSTGRHAIINANKFPEE